MDCEYQRGQDEAVGQTEGSLAPHPSSLKNSYSHMLPCYLPPYHLTRFQFFIGLIPGAGDIADASLNYFLVLKPAKNELE
jgi:hypothetical protein